MENYLEHGKDRFGLSLMRYLLFQIEKNNTGKTGVPFFCKHLTYIPDPRKTSQNKIQISRAPSKPITPRLLQSLSYISGRKCLRSYYRNEDENAPLKE